MSVSAEYVALANQAVLRTFEQTCVTWRALPHWDTRDPGQALVRADVVTVLDQRSGSLPLSGPVTTFEITLAQATAPTPDQLLGTVIAKAAELAADVDADVLPQLAPARPDDAWYRKLTLGPAPSDADVGALLGALLDGRGVLEDQGYRSGSCLLAGTAAHKAMNQLVGGVLVTDELLRAGTVGAAYRAGVLDGGPTVMVMVGRRQDMPDGSATHASAGEEPVDLAVSVPPSLEVVGETAEGKIELAVRVRYALRRKDDHGVVVFHS